MTRLIWGLLVALPMLASILPARACTMTIAPIPATVAVSRIAGFDLTMHHGSVTGMRILPYAWRLSIHNDEDFDTTVSGFAIVGVAFLDPPEITHLFALTPEPDDTCAEPERLHVVHLSLKLYRGDSLKLYRGDAMTRFIVEPRFIHIGE